MSLVYIRMLIVAALVIAITGASFSVLGLAQLFSGAAYSVAVMAIALEFAKLVTTGFLYRYWGHIHRPLRLYLAFAVITLVGITSVGIFGYLSNAYQKSSFVLKTQQLHLTALEDDHHRTISQIAELRRFIDEIPARRISQKYVFEKQYAPRIRALYKKSEQILEDANKIKLEMLSTHTKIGPAIFLADALGVPIDTVVRFLILIFVLVFDPLAVSLVFCLNLAIRLREKYRGQEAKISAHSLSSPVDHRLKKAS